MFKYIQNHFTENIAINNLATEYGLSLRQFERKFKEQLRITPRELIIKMRIQLACDQLQDPKNELSEIAYSCGFYDQSALTRQFKKHMGFTPSQYRKHYY
jgi:AraC-like DNA-binding protein